MPELTLELVEAKQTELAALIEKLRIASKATVLKIPAAEISLMPGEWYAGAVLNEDGTVNHHLICAAVRAERGDANTIESWAKERGYALATEQQARLLLAHNYGRLGDIGAFWIDKPHSNPAYAWSCYLYGGTVSSYFRSAELGGVVVRSVKP